MAGHRDDGSFAEDKAHHPGRRVSNMEDYRILKKSRQFEAMRNHPAYKGHPDDANPYGIERPDVSKYEY